MDVKFNDPLVGLDRCPQCGVATPFMEQKLLFNQRLGRSNSSLIWGLYHCHSCDRMCLAESYPVPVSNSSQVRLGEYPVSRFYPPPRMVDQNIPSEARRFMKQAIDTLFAPDAAIVMAASAVDAMLKSKGYKTGNLYSRIDQAVAEHVLTEGMGKWAHKVRLDANAVRHVDDTLSPPTEADAANVVDFASALGDFLFVFTARVDKAVGQDGSVSGGPS